MSTADDESPQPARARRWARMKKWAPAVVAAVVLLALSQALWLWQSWPVRQLLQSSAAMRGVQ